MARSWEYSGARRIIMQLVMWVIFGGSLALAGWVTHSRSKTFSTSLSSIQVSMGRVGFRYPSGWMPLQDLQRGRMLVQEPHRDGEPFHTLIFILEAIDTQKLTADAYLTQVLDGRQFQLEPMRFRGLGPGTLAMVNGLVSEDPTIESPYPPILVACTMIPADSRNPASALTISLKGMPAFSRADQNLIQQVADSVTLAK